MQQKTSHIIQPGLTNENSATQCKEKNQCNQYPNEPLLIVSKLASETVHQQNIIQRKEMKGDQPYSQL